MQKKAVVLLSGGLDSVTVLAMAQAQDYECFALPGIIPILIFSAFFGLPILAALLCFRILKKLKFFASAP